MDNNAKASHPLRRHRQCATRPACRTLKRAVAPAMDGFDDLLSRSRGVLDNPFEDPFAKPRSISPDPWASFGQPSVTHEDHDAFLGARSTTPTLDTHGFGDSEGFQYPASEPSPVEDHKPDTHLEETELQTSSTEDHADERESHTPTPDALATPGFRESVSSPIHEAEKHEEEKPQREPSPPLAQSEPPESPTPPATAPATYGSFMGHASRPSNTSTFRAEPAYESPLDRPPAVNIESSLNGLSIGGEAFNGWQSESEASTYPASPPTPTAPAQPSRSDDSDSSDDDRPILQSSKLANRMSLQAVRVDLAMCSSSTNFLPYSQDRLRRERRMACPLHSP